MTDLTQEQRFEHAHIDEVSDKDAAFARAQKHSRRVSVLKTVLPLVAGAIALGFVAYSYAVTPNNVSINVAESAISDGKLVMASPKLEGFTRENKPYSMTATRAYQDLTNAGLVELVEIAAKLPYEDNEVMLKAPGGFYDQTGNTLDIRGDLTVKTSDGMSALLKSAFIDIAKGDLKTSDPVDIQLNGTRISADSMTVQDRGKILIFDKRVRMVVEPKRAQAKPNGS